MGVGGVAVHASHISFASGSLSCNDVHKNTYGMNAFIKIVKNAWLRVFKSLHRDHSARLKVKARQMEFDFSPQKRSRHN